MSGLVQKSPDNIKPTSMSWLWPNDQSSFPASSFGNDIQNRNTERCKPLNTAVVISEKTIGKRRWTHTTDEGSAEGSLLTSSFHLFTALSCFSFANLTQTSCSSFGIAAKSSLSIASCKGASLFEGIPCASTR